MLRIILFAFLALYSIHNLMKSVSVIRKGGKPNVAVMILSIIALVCSLLILIIQLGDINI